MALIALIKFNLNGSDFVMVLNIDISPGVEAIVSEFANRSLQDLIGKSIVVGRGTTMSLWLPIAQD